MALDFTDILTRAESGGADLPQSLAEDLVLATIRESTLMSLARTVPTKTLDSRIPVLTQLPEAYWVQGDAGLKQATQAAFQNQSLYAMEVAAVAPIPQALLDDSQFNIWSSIRPLLARACAKKVDEAAIWGIGVPVLEDGVTPAWPASVVSVANAAGAHTPYTADPVESLLNAAILVSGQGYNASGAAVSNGWQFRASAARATSLIANPVDGIYPLNVAGLGIHPNPLVWHPANADAIVCDFQNVIYGLRQDITITLHTDGVISDDTGKVVLNLMQQDSVAARVVLRCGYRTLTPPTDVDPTTVLAADGTPAGLTALTPAAFVAPHA